MTGRLQNVTTTICESQNWCNTSQCQGPYEDTPKDNIQN